MKKLLKSRTPWLFILGGLFEFLALYLVLIGDQDRAGVSMLSGYIFIGWGWIDNYNLYRKT